jgi:hypothetical protein
MTKKLHTNIQMVALGVENPHYYGLAVQKSIRRHSKLTMTKLLCKQRAKRLKPTLILSLMIISKI